MEPIVRILVTVLVCLPMIVGGLLLASLELWIFEHGFMSGAQSPGKIGDLIAGILCLAVAASGFGLAVYVWIRPLIAHP